MAHVTGTDLQDLQFDALATSTLGNPQLPSSPISTLNKALKTTSKFVIGAINEVNTLALGTSNAFTSFSATYNNILGDTQTNPALLTDLQKIDQNVLLALVKVYKEIHGPDLDSPIALAGDIATILGDVGSKAHVHANQVALDAVSGVNTGDQDLSGLAPMIHAHAVTDVTGLQGLLDAKEATLALGSASQYYRGDKTWQTLDTDAVAEGTNLYYTDARVAAYIAANNNGANQVAVTDASGKLPTYLIPIGAIGGLVNKGVWDASTNTPTLTVTPPVGSSGWFYIVSVAGTQFGTTWSVGDWAISDGAAWLRIDNTNNPNSVISVFGRPGPNIVADSADYAAFYVSLTGSYADPSWVTSLASSKLTGVVSPDNLGTGTRDGTKFLRDDGAWETVTLPLGTVYSVGLAMPGEFTITNSPVTSTGTLTAGWASQAANLFLASPDGSAGTPSFRVIAPGDIPGIDADKIISGTLSTLRIPDLDAAKITTGTFNVALLGTGVRDGLKFLRDDGEWTAITAGTVTSVGLSAPAEFDVSNSPVTSAGTLSFAWANVSNPSLVFASPESASGTPGFRSLVAGDIPGLDAAKITSGIFATALLGSGTADSTVYLRGDGSWASVPAGGTVTSVGLELPSLFTVTNSPVTGAGTLTATLAQQAANLVFAAPDGLAGTPGFRALLAADIPDLDAAKIASGVLDVTRIPDLDAAKITTGTVTTARLGSGTADTTTFLRGDGTWQTVATNAVTSVGLDAPTEFTVSNSPITSTGSLTMAWADQTANLVFAAPDGATGTPGFRALLAGDIPNLDAAKITSGVVGTDRLGTGTADTTTFLRGDGTWQVVSGSGSVTSVGLALPGEFTVTNSPVTGAGVLTGAWATQAANLVFAGPATGADAVPGFRALAVADLGTGTPDATTFLRGDGTWSTTSTGVFQAVKFTASNNNYGLYSGLLTASATFNAHGWYVSTAALDTKTWDMLATVNSFEGRLVNDANSTVAAWLKVDRAAMIATNVTITGTAITLTGAVTATSIAKSGGTSAQYLMADGSVSTGAAFSGTYSGGVLTLNNATSNWITFGNGYGIPSYPSRSGGTRLVLRSSLSSVAVDAAIGVDTDALWMSIPSNVTTNFDWYANVTRIMQLSHQGQLRTYSKYQGLGLDAGLVIGTESNEGSVASITLGLRTAGSNERYWTMSSQGFTIDHAAVDDAGTASTTYLRATRSYHVVSDVHLYASSTVYIGAMDAVQSSEVRVHGQYIYIGKSAATENIKIGEGTSATIEIGSQGATVTNTVFTGNVAFGTATVTGLASTSSSWTVSGGYILLNHGVANSIGFADSTTNAINLGKDNGVGIPSTNTQSAGTKLILRNDRLADTYVDYALGIESGAMWASVYDRAASFKWYAKTFNLMTLSGAGRLSVFSDYQGNGKESGIVASTLVGGGGPNNYATIGTYVHTGTVDSKAADVFAYSTGIQHRLVNDASNLATVYIDVTRTGYAATTAKFYGATTYVGWNGTSRADNTYIAATSNVFVGYDGTTYSSSISMRPTSSLNLGSLNTTTVNIGNASSTINIGAVGSTTNFLGTITGISGAGAPSAFFVWNNGGSAAATLNASTKISAYNQNVNSSALWDGVNQRLRPTVAGWYWVSATTYFQTTSPTPTNANAASYYGQTSIYKNGTGQATGSSTLTIFSGQATCFSTASCMVYMNGTSDVVEHYYSTNIPSGNIYYSYQSQPLTHFSAALIK